MTASECIERVGQSRKVKKVKRERERENGKVIDKREREREGNGRKNSFIFFVFNIYFFPSDTPSLRCLQWISGVCEHTHQAWLDPNTRNVRSESATHRRDVWEFVWFTDGCLFGCGWPHIQGGVRFTYLISLLCSLSLSLSLILPITHTHSHTLCLLTHTHSHTHIPRSHTPTHTHPLTHTHKYLNRSHPHPHALTLTHPQIHLTSTLTHTDSFTFPLFYSLTRTFIVYC